MTNCYAHDGVGVNKVLLIDENGCPAHDPEFVSPMQHGRMNNGDVVHYTNFQAFKFPDKSNVYFQCTVEVCRDKCQRVRYTVFCVTYVNVIRLVNTAVTDCIVTLLEILYKIKQKWCYCHFIIVIHFQS